MCHEHGFPVTLKLILITYTVVPNTACDSGKELSLSVVHLDEWGKIRAIYLSECAWLCLRKTRIASAEIVYNSYIFWYSVNIIKLQESKNSQIQILGSEDGKYEKYGAVGQLYGRKP